MKTIKDFFRGSAAGIMLAIFPLLLIVCSLLMSAKYWFAALYDAHTGEETFFEVSENSVINDFVVSYYSTIKNWMHGK